MSPPVHHEENDRRRTPRTPLLSGRMPAVPPSRPVTAICAIDSASELVLAWSDERRALTLGSAKPPAVDVRLHALGVSRHHLTLHQQGNQVEVIDAGSRNGVYFEGEREKSRCVAAGTIFRIADTEVITLDDDLRALRPRMERVLGYSVHAEVNRALAKAAGSRPLVLLGRTGCDHGPLARAIHCFSKRGEAPIISVPEDVALSDEAITSAWGGTIFVDLEAAGVMPSTIAANLLAPKTHARLILAARSWRTVETTFGKERARPLAAGIIELPALSTRAAEVPRIFDSLFVDELKSDRSITELGASNVQALIAHTWHDNIAGIRRVMTKLHARIVAESTAEAAAAVGVKPQSFWDTLDGLGLVFADPRRSGSKKGPGR
jgi:transcriptional regulator of acetoin/glycerol metabolism